MDNSQGYLKEHIVDHLSKTGYMIPISIYRNQFVPSYICIKANMDLSFAINKIDMFRFEKNKEYVVPTGIYHSLINDSKNKKRSPYVKLSKKPFSKLYRPYEGQNLNGKTLLVSRLGGIGDLLYIQPSVNIIKRQFPKSKIIFATRPSFHMMVQNWENVDSVITFPFPMKALIRTDYHGIFEGVIERTFESKIINAYELFAQWLGLKNYSVEDLMPYQEPKKDAIKYCLSILDEWNVKPYNFIILQKRASALNRTPPDEIWIKILEKIRNLNIPIVITDEPKFYNEHEKFIKEIGLNNIYNFSMYSKNIYYSIAMTSLARMAVCPDTSMIPISTSVRTPCFHIHGAYPPILRQSPNLLYTESIRGESECGPCFKMAWENCDRKCYYNVNIDLAYEKICKLLDKTEDLYINKEIPNAA